MSEQNGATKHRTPAEFESGDPSKKLCPILSVATLRDVGSVVQVGPAGPRAKQGSATPCQGMQCALFVPIMDASGSLFDGACALTMLPQAINVAAQVLRTAPIPQSALEAQPVSV